MYSSNLNNDLSGSSVSLSSDGTIVAIGARFNDGNGNKSGHVRVYKYKIPTGYEWNDENVIKDGDLNQQTDKKYFTQSDIECFHLFDYFLKGVFPNAKLILAYCERRAWKSIVPELDNIKKIPFVAKETVVDLARDGFHPGVLSHKIMADKIIKGIKNV